MWTVLADLLVSEGAAHHLAEDGRVAEGLEGLVQRVHQRVEELEGIMLFPQVHWLTPESRNKVKGHSPQSGHRVEGHSPSLDRVNVTHLSINPESKITYPVLIWEATKLLMRLMVILGDFNQMLFMLHARFGMQKQIFEYTKSFG